MERPFKHQAAANKAAARAHALAARAPAVAHVHLKLMYPLPTGLMAAYASALSALLARPGAGRSFSLTASTSAPVEAKAALAAAAPHASCERLELIWHSRSGEPVSLEASQRLPSLPHVQRMRICLVNTRMLSERLPMPSLEELELPEIPEMFAPIVTRGVALGERGRQLPACFPALRRLRVATTALILRGTMPVLEQLSVTLYSPDAELRLLSPGPGAMPSTLASLDLNASTINTLEMLEEGGFGEEEEEEDRSVRSNALAPVLGAAAASLRRLQLTLGEPPDASLEAALCAATGLTSLALRFTGKGWRPGDDTRMDCRLLGGMAQLQELVVDAGDRMDAPQALASLPLSGLVLGNPDALPTIAPHVTAALTRLELSSYSAAALHGAEALVQQALADLPLLRRLVLGGREELCRRNNAEGSAAAESITASHAAAMGALRTLLPAGCRVQAEPPLVRLW